MYFYWNFDGNFNGNFVGMMGIWIEILTVSRLSRSLALIAFALFLKSSPV